MTVTNVSAIEALDLELPAVPDIDIDRSKSIGDGDAAAAVNGSAVVAFGTGISAQEREDILYSMQLAAAASNKKANRETEIAAWYNEYIRVLGLTGWVVRGFAPQRRTMAEGDVDVDQVALTILAAAITGPALQVMKVAIEALKGMADDSGQIRLLEFYGADGKVGNFQLGAVERGAGDELNLGIGAYQFVMKQRKKKILFIKWRRQDVDLWGGAANATFNPAAYATVRKTVLERLGPSRIDAIAALDLAL